MTMQSCPPSAAPFLNAALSGACRTPTTRRTFFLCFFFLEIFFRFFFFFFQLALAFDRHTRRGCKTKVGSGVHSVWYAVAPVNTGPSASVAPVWAGQCLWSTRTTRCVPHSQLFFPRPSHTHPPTAVCGAGCVVVIWLTWPGTRLLAPTRHHPFPRPPSQTHTPQQSAQHCCGDGAGVTSPQARCAVE